MTRLSRPWPVLSVVALPLLFAAPGTAEQSPPRQYLDQALAATSTITLDGDRSAALREIVDVLAPIDAPKAKEAVARMRRPSDAARALARIATAAPDAAGGRQLAAAAGGLLLRLPDLPRREAEQRFLLYELAAFGEEALPAAQELPQDQARLAVVTKLARTDPARALDLMDKWALAGVEADSVRADAAGRLAASDPARALKAADAITAASVREQALWLIAEMRPAQEAEEIARRIYDPVIRSAVIASALLRSPGGGEPPIDTLQPTVAPASAAAERVVALGATDIDRAIQLARSLPERPRRWALSRLAIRLAAFDAPRARSLLEEVGLPPEAVRQAVSQMAAVDPAGAIGLARSLPAEETREAALAAAIAVLAPRDPRRAADILWDMQSSHWRGVAARPVALALAAADVDAATALIGLVSDPLDACRLRAEIAVVAAAQNPAVAASLLASLPASDYRTDAALAAAAAAIEARRSAEEAVRVAQAGAGNDVGLRWLLPELARSQTASVASFANRIESPYVRCLALVDAAREVLGEPVAPRPSPERARQIRVITEWEQR